MTVTHDKLRFSAGFSFLIWKYPDHEKIRKVPVFRDPERYFAESTRLSPKHPRPRPTKEKIIVQPVKKQ